MIRLKTTKTELKSILSTLSASVPQVTKETGDIYGTMLLDSDGHNKISATTTNRHSTASCKFTGSWSEEFSFCLPFKRIAQLVPLLGEEEIEIVETEPGWVVIKNGKSKHKIPFRDSNNFPILSYVESSRFQVNLEHLYQGLKACSIAVSKDDKASWKLACIGLKTEGDTIKLRSCDGRQISMAVLKMEEEVEPVEVLIPQQAINFLLKFVNDKSDNLIDVIISPTHLVLQKNEDRLIMTLVDGVFPDIERLFVSEFTTDLTTSILDLKAALLRIQTSTDEFGKVSVSIMGEEINILATGSKGKGFEVLECENTSNQERVDFGINVAQIIDFLKTSEGRVRIGIPENDRVPLHFWPLDIDNIGFTYLSMRTV